MLLLAARHPAHLLAARPAGVYLTVVVTKIRSIRPRCIPMGGEGCGPDQARSQKKRKAPALKGAIRRVRKAARKSRDRFDGQEEVRSAGDPACSIR
jgi:hypothetical protein